MQHYQRLNDIQLENSLVTIGSFDGVHLGHQQIIRDLVRNAGEDGVPAAVITFHPHPQLVIKNESRPYYLTLPDQRARLLGELGVDLVLTYPFDRETSQLTAEAFTSKLLERFNFTELWIGYDFALGRDREGNAAKLRELGLRLGFQVHEVPPYSFQGELVSSSGIRKQIREGNLKAAAQLLGRPFEVAGEVIRGDDRGKSLGFATSNLAVPPEVVDIKPGVYACWAEIGGKVHAAVTNVGFRPTFGPDLTAPRIEAHLLDFSGDLYGQELRLGFVDRLRDELKFEKASDLVQQIHQDIARARQILDV